jgi:hypothetical protein
MPQKKMLTPKRSDNVRAGSVESVKSQEEYLAAAKLSK